MTAMEFEDGSYLPCFPLASIKSIILGVYDFSFPKCNYLNEKLKNNLKVVKLCTWNTEIHG